jgi:hypothetical protein
LRALAALEEGALLVQLGPLWTAADKQRVLATAPEREADRHFPRFEDVRVEIG